MSRLRDHYTKKVVPELMKEFKYSSVMQVPRLTKIVINSGVGDATQNQKALQHVEYALRQISGQKPVVTKAKKAIATFKLRKGLGIGVMVTLRGPRMFSFADRLFSVALPRVRDFRGVAGKGFDGRGSFTMGLRESTVFPEVNMEKLDKDRGMNITFVTTAKNDAEGRALLTHLGLPFRK